jgi:molecular chaperone DnaK
MFTTTADGQKYVRIEVGQGESETFEHNQKLGEVVLSGLREAPRGEISVAVTFEINADGLLEVRALDHDTGQQQVATMRVLGGLGEDEVEEMAERMANAYPHGGVAPKR